MLKIAHVLTATLTSITPLPSQDTHYTIVYLSPPPHTESSFIIKQLPSFHFLPGAPLGVAYRNVVVRITPSQTGAWYGPDLDCGELAETNITNLGSDPHGLDGDGDGIGCEE